MIICNVMSRTAAVSASYKLKEKTAIISINNIDMSTGFKKSDNLIDVLALYFSDTDNGGEFSMSEEDAVKIRNFLGSVLSRIDRLIIHCEMGVSRSAGIAAAIMKALTGNDQSVFESNRFVPNMHCYRTVLNALLDESGKSVLGSWNLQFKEAY